MGWHVQVAGGADAHLVEADDVLGAGILERLGGQAVRAIAGQREAQVVVEEADAALRQVIPASRLRGGQAGARAAGRALQVMFTPLGRRAGGCAAGAVAELLGLCSRAWQRVRQSSGCSRLGRNTTCK